MKLNNIIYYDDFMYPTESKFFKKELSKQFNLVVINHYLIDFFLNKNCLNKNCLNKKQDFDSVFDSYKNLELKQRRTTNIVNWLVYRYRPVATVFGFTGFLYESLMSNAFKALGIKTISVAHSGLGHIINFDGVDTNENYLLCWNEYDKAVLSKSKNLYGCKIIDVGSMRYINEYNDYERQSKEKIYKKSNNILICTSYINTGLSLIISDPKKHQNNLNQIKEWALERVDKNFYIKCHPSYDYYSYYEYLYADIKNITIIKSNNEIKKIKFDAAISMNYCTTYMLEMMLKRVPVIIYDEAIYCSEGSMTILPDLILKKISKFKPLKNIIDDINELNKIMISQDYFIKSIINKKELSKIISDLKLNKNITQSPCIRGNHIYKLMTLLSKFSAIRYYLYLLWNNNQQIKFDDYLYFININNYYRRNFFKKIFLKFLMLPYALRSVRNRRLIKESLL